MFADSNRPTAIRIMGNWVRRADALLSQQSQLNAQEAVSAAQERRARFELDLTLTETDTSIQ